MSTWWKMVGILQEARDLDRQRKSRIPSVCPYDYTPLIAGPKGKLHCPFNGDYTWPDDGLID